MREDTIKMLTEFVQKTGISPKRFRQCSGSMREYVCASIEMTEDEYKKIGYEFNGLPVKFKNFNWYSGKNTAILHIEKYRLQGDKK